MTTFILLLSGLALLIALHFARERRNGTERRANRHKECTRLEASSFTVPMKDRREVGWRIAYAARNDAERKYLLSQRDLLRKANASVLRSLRRVRGFSPSAAKKQKLV